MAVSVRVVVVGAPVMVVGSVMVMYAELRLHRTAMLFRQIWCVPDRREGWCPSARLDVDAGNFWII